MGTDTSGVKHSSSLLWDSGIEPEFRELEETGTGDGLYP